MVASEVGSPRDRNPFWEAAQDAEDAAAAQDWLARDAASLTSYISLEEAKRCLFSPQEGIDAADLAVAQAVLTAGNPTLPHHAVMAAFEALDAADLAKSPEHAAAILAPHAAVLDAAAEADGARPGPLTHRAVPGSP